MGVQLTWSQAQIRLAIGGSVDGEDENIVFRLFDAEVPMGVGLMPNGSVVLMGPGEPNDDELYGRKFHYQPWRSVFPKNEQAINDVSLLIVKYDGITNEELDALSVLFAGLVSLNSSNNGAPRSGRMIRAIVGLLENRMVLEVSREIQIGLIGELLLMLNSSDPDLIIDAWRSRDDAAYDFSSNNECLEVKTTTLLPREHSFSSNQLPPRDGLNLVVVSVLINEVENGVSIAEIYRKLDSQLQNEVNQRKLLRCCMQTLGHHPDAVDSIEIEMASSLASIVLYSPGSIPTPKLVPGVSRLRWNANMPQNPVTPVLGNLSALLL
jgi:hypothetical protein